MKRISTYIPPSPANLAGLKTRLGFTSQQMADLSGLSQGSHWRRYTGGADPRSISLQMHFYMAALLTLTESELARVLTTMGEHGAEIEVGPLPAGPCK